MPSWSIDDASGFARDRQYNRHYQLDRFHVPSRKATPSERLEPLGRIRRRIRRSLNASRPYSVRDYVAQVGMDFDARLLELRTSNSVYLDGYWQSERYFKDVEATIRSDLRIVPPTDSVNVELAAQMRKGVSVAVHVRFFDRAHVQDTKTHLPTTTGAHWRTWRSSPRELTTFSSPTTRTQHALTSPCRLALHLRHPQSW